MIWQRRYLALGILMAAAPVLVGVAISLHHNIGLLPALLLFVLAVPGLFLIAHHFVEKARRKKRKKWW